MDAVVDAVTPPLICSSIAVVVGGDVKGFLDAEQELVMMERVIIKRSVVITSFSGIHLQRDPCQKRHKNVVFKN